VFLFAIQGPVLGSTKAEVVPECVTVDHICGIHSSRDPRRTYSTTAPLWKSLTCKIFGLKREGITGDGRKLHNEEFVFI